MIRKTILASFVASSIASVAAAQEQQALRLAPTTPWALEYADENCRLVRTFGIGEQEVTLGLTAYQPGGIFQLSAIGHLTRTLRTPATVGIRLGDVEGYDLRFMQVDFGGRPGILITNPITVGPLPAEAIASLEARRPVASYSDPEVEARVTEIGFVDGFEQEFILQTGSLGAPMRALKDCNAELLTHWDIDQVAHTGLSRIAFPTTPPWRWIEMNGYPRELRRPTMINYRLIVDAEGNVAGCHVAGLADTEEFSRVTCEQLSENARFDAALDANGNPVRSYYASWHELVE